MDRQMVFHFTQKLRKKLDSAELTTIPVPSAPHLRWYATLFRARQVQYVLVANAASLYAVVMYGRGMTGMDSFHRRFMPALREQMEADGMKFIHDRCIAPFLGAMVLAKTADRSVLGSMNDMVWSCKCLVDLRDCDPFSLGAAINSTPYGALKYRFPKEVMMALPLEG